MALEPRGHREGRGRGPVAGHGLRAARTPRRWKAATGSPRATPALVCFLTVFLWTPPHFWVLALVKQEEYGRVGMPMAPNVWGERRTLRQMLGYAAVLVPISVAPTLLGSLGGLYGALALLLGVWFLRDLVRVARAADITAPAWAAYRTSLLYLVLLFGAVGLDRWVAAALG